ncbi:MAG: hypothetical protein KAU28_06650, partial [Phycisphaerae bacterium]|nr:hypothetical protein [Phycisphaerae bacterium]
MSDGVVLRDVAVVVSPDVPGASYLDHSVAELGRYLRLTGAGAGRLARGGSAPGRSQIVIELSPPAAGKSPEAFEIVPSPRGARTKGLAVRARTAKGLMRGIIELIKGLKPTRGGVAWPHGRVGKSPANEVRGMYAHMHWAYKRPYSVRAWTLSDWKRYIDLLAFFGANRLQIWVVPDIMPYPLPAGDVRFLERLREAVGYAKHCRGMFVSVGGCANTIGRAEQGDVPIEKRDYFRAEMRLDPGKKADMALLMKQRREVYKILNNADGVWIIDSDPGGYAGSTVDEFVDIFVQSEKVLGRCCPNAQLEYWMWAGWNNAAKWYGSAAAADPGWLETLKKLKQRLNRPWGVLACPRVTGVYKEHADVVGKLGLEDRSIIYPYGSVEGEPNYPLTEWFPESVDGAFATNWPRRGYRGMQSNAQTP